MKRTALHIASEAGHASIVTALLNNNVNCDTFDCEGKLYTCVIYHIWDPIVNGVWMIFE